MQGTEAAHRQQNGDFMKYTISYYHNEIELVRVDSPELKNKIERAFLRNRISYFVRWDKVSLWQRLLGQRESKHCRICINDWDKEKALEILKEYDGLIASQGEMLLKRAEISLPKLYVNKQN